MVRHSGLNRTVAASLSFRYVDGAYRTAWFGITTCHKSPFQVFIYSHAFFTALLSLHLFSIRFSTHIHSTILCDLSCVSVWWRSFQSVAACIIFTQSIAARTMVGTLWQIELSGLEHPVRTMVAD